MKVTRISPLTGRETTLDLPVTEDQIESWKSGMFIQNAMPNLTPDEREFIKTGYTKEDWDNMFPEDEDDL